MSASSIIACRKLKNGSTVYGLRPDGQWVVMPTRAPDFETARMELEITPKLVGFEDLHKQIQEAAGKGCSCKTGGKAVAKKLAFETNSVSSTKGIHEDLPIRMPPVKGSYEAISKALEDSAPEFFEAEIGSESYSKDLILMATFEKEAIVCQCNVWSATVDKAWTAAWEINSDGVPEWNGEKKEVTITTEIKKGIESASLALKGFKLGRSMGRKAVDEALGKKMNKSETSQLGGACEMVKACHKDPDLHPLEDHTKAMLEKSTNYMDEVLDEVRGTEEEGSKSLDTKKLSKKHKEKITSAHDQIKGVLDSPEVHPLKTHTKAVLKHAKGMLERLTSDTTNTEYAERAGKLATKEGFKPEHKDKIDSANELVKSVHKNPDLHPLEVHTKETLRTSTDMLDEVLEDLADTSSEDINNGDITTDAEAGRDRDMDNRHISVLSRRLLARLANCKDFEFAKSVRDDIVTVTAAMESQKQSGDFDALAKELCLI